MKSFDQVADFHGHSCPGLAYGYRVALAAMKEMDMENISGDEEIVAIVENDSCAVDAVQVLTGCTFGKGNLIFRDYGKQVYTFIKRPSGDAIRISIDLPPMEETEKEKEMWKRYSESDRSEEVLRAVHKRRAKRIEVILEADEAELLKIRKGNIPPPQEAEIYLSIRCEICREKVAEPRLRVKNGKMICIPCFEGKDVWGNL